MSVEKVKYGVASMSHAPASQSTHTPIFVVVAAAVAILLLVGIIAVRAAGLLVALGVGAAVIAFFVFVPRPSTSSSQYAQDVALTATRAVEALGPNASGRGPLEATRYVVPPTEFGDAIAAEQCTSTMPREDPGFIVNPDKNPGWIDSTQAAMDQVRNDTWRERMYTKDINALVMARSMLLGDERPVTNLSAARRSFDVATFGEVRGGRYCRPVDPALLTNRYRPFHPPQPNLVKPESR